MIYDTIFYRPLIYKNKHQKCCSYREYNLINDRENRDRMIETKDTSD